MEIFEHDVSHADDEKPLFECISHIKYILNKNCLFCLPTYNLYHGTLLIYYVKRYFIFKKVLILKIEKKH